MSCFVEEKNLYKMNISIYTNFLSLATPVFLIANGYAITTNPTLCVLNYKLLNFDGTLYTGTDVSVDSSSGAVSIISRILFNTNLKI